MFFKLFINVIFIPFTLDSNDAFSGSYLFSVHLGRFIVLPFSHHSKLQIVCPESSTQPGEPKETLSQDVWVCASRHRSEMGGIRHGALRKFSHKAWGRGCSEDMQLPSVTALVPGLWQEEETFLVFCLQSSLSPQSPDSLTFYIPTYCEDMHVHTSTHRLHTQTKHNPCITYITHSTCILHIHTTCMFIHNVQSHAQTKHTHTPHTVYIQSTYHTHHPLHICYPHIHTLAKYTHLLLTLKKHTKHTYTKE